jgi:hypothetical protein
VQPTRLPRRASDWRCSLGKEIDRDHMPVPSHQALVTYFCSRQATENRLEQAGFGLLSLALGTSAGEVGRQRDWLAQCRMSEAPIAISGQLQPRVDNQPRSVGGAVRHHLHKCRLEIR